MGVVFWLLGYVSGFLTLVLIALSISSGLYLLAELAEEFPSMSGKVTKYLLISVLVLQVVLWIDGLPLRESVGGLVAHLIYASMLRNFPFVDLVSLPTIGSVFAFVGSNVMWLFYFTRRTSHFVQVVGFFVLCVWSVPCALFVSLTPSDNALPVLSGPGARMMHGDGTDSGPAGGGKKKSMFKMISDPILGFFEKFGNVSGVVQALNTVSNKRK
jgi:hypothetical protein